MPSLPSYPPTRSPSSSSTATVHSPLPHRQTPRRSSSAHEMDAAFDDSGSDDDDDDDENVPLSRTVAGRAGGVQGGGRGERAETITTNHGSTPAGEDPLRSRAAEEQEGAFVGEVRTEQQQYGVREGEQGGEGGYDFDRDYFLPPPGSPPPGAYPEAYLPSGPTPLTTTPAYPQAPSASSRFIRSILPTHFTRSATPPATRGSDGVFANIMAKPEVERPTSAAGEDGENGAVMAEFTQKDGPPSYNVALRDAVPAYWEHNVVAPQLGPLGSFSGSGDDLLLDGLPIGNFFGFAWNLLVSLSFQFVGFLLTYVLHTTHAAKYGSRAGLGITLIQYGLYLRARGEEIIESGSLDPDVGATDASPFGRRGGVWWGVSDENGVPSGGLATATLEVGAVASATSTAALAIPTFSSKADADRWAQAHNTTMWDVGPNVVEVGEANEYLSFVLMCVGWFILLTSLGGYWRVKRFERSLLISQQTDSSSSPATDASPSTSINPTRSWFTPPGASSSSNSDDSPITTSRPNAFAALGQSVRGLRDSVRERVEVMRSGGAGRGRRQQVPQEDEEELMLE